MTTHNFPSMKPFTDDDIWVDPEFLLNATEISDDGDVSIAGVLQINNQDSDETITIIFPAAKMRGLGSLLENMANAYEMYDGDEAELVAEAEKYGAALPNDEQINQGLEDLLGGN